MHVVLIPYADKNAGVRERGMGIGNGNGNGMGTAHINRIIIMNLRMETGTIGTGRD